MQEYIDTNNKSYKNSNSKSYSSAPKKYIHKTSVWPTQEGIGMFEKNEGKYPFKIISSTIEIVSERESLKGADSCENQHKTQSTHINEIEFWCEFSLIVLPSYERCNESKKKLFDKIDSRNMEYIPKEYAWEYAPWEKSNQDCKSFIENRKFTEC